MANFSDISFANAIKFLKNTTTPGIHLDDDFASQQIKSFETHVCYWQPWLLIDNTPLQLYTTVAPASVKVYTGAGVLTDIEFEWTLVATGATLNVSLYECLIDWSAVEAGFYHLYFECTLLSYSAKFVSEKQNVRASHSNTMLYSYFNSYNHLGVYWSTGIVMNFRCQAGLMDYQPEVEGADFTDQIHDVSLLSAVPYDTFKLYIGEAPGVPNYMIKIQNFIWACDNVRLRRDLNDGGLQFVKPISEKWESTRVKGWPNAGWATTVQPAVNQSSLQYNDDGNPLAPGIVTAYNIDSNLFSTEHVEIVHITEVIYV